MAFSEPEKKIIQWGLDNKKSKEEVMQALTNFRLGAIAPKPEEKDALASGGTGKEEKSGPGYWERVTGAVGEDIQKRFERVDSIENRKDSNILEKGFQIFGQGAGMAANALEKLVTEIPGVQKLIDGTLGKGMEWLITSENSPAKFLGEKLGANEAFQKVVGLYDSDPNFKDTVDALSNTIRLGTDVQGIVGGANFVKNVTNKLTTLTKEAVAPAAEAAAGAAESVIDTAKSGIDKVIEKGKGIFKRFTGRTEAGDMKPTVAPEVLKRAETDVNFAKVLGEAQKQGFDESAINFLSTVSDTDKPILKEMFDLTVKAQSDPRQVKRAADVLGDSILKQVKEVQAINAKAGKAVDEAAKGIRGLAVETDELRGSILKTLQDNGIGINEKTGALDFSQSVFKNVPTVQKELQKAIQTVPDGSDAYQLHIFKKSLDEILNYGTAGEGLSGQASRLLKGLRAEVDKVLDSSFPEYNTANESFRHTREFLDEAIGIAGRNVDLSTKEGAQAFGQSMRAAFSNSKSRGSTLTFIEDLQKMGKELKLTGAEQDILDQAIFVTILEETFGSQAATGLAGEVTKAIKTAAEAIRNPVKGGLNVVADMLEKMQGISPEAKRKVLEMFLNLK